MTALLAALIALTQFDLKRVLAYSTVSQLGYMFLSLGTGTLAGISAGMFHLMTHAFFKALLFLGAGSVMHAMGNVIDMRRFGGLRQRLPWTHRTFLVGCLALAGVFPFAGFWSKDQIVAAVHSQAHSEQADSSHAAESASQELEGNWHEVALSAQAPSSSVGTWTAEFDRGAIFRGLYFVSLFTAFLTAFYTFRAYFMTFFGPEEVPNEVGHHAHESPPFMVVPLVILAVCAFGVGFVFELADRFNRFLATTPSLAYLVPADGIHGGEFHWDVAVISTVVALLGISLSAFLYLGHRREVEILAARLRPLRELSYHKFFFDELYQFVIVWPLKLLGQISYLLDQWLVDGLVNSAGRVPLWIGSFGRRLQRGLVPFYGLMMAVSAIVILGLGGLWWFGG